MPSSRPTYCRVCGRGEEEVGRISWRGKCATCGDALLLEARYSIKAHSGPAFTHWRRRMAASVGGVLLDERADEG